VHHTSNITSRCHCTIANSSTTQHRSEGSDKLIDSVQYENNVALKAVVSEIKEVVPALAALRCVTTIVDCCPPAVCYNSEHHSMCSYACALSHKCSGLLRAQNATVVTTYISAVCTATLFNGLTVTQDTLIQIILLLLSITHSIKSRHKAPSTLLHYCYDCSAQPVAVRCARYRALCVAQHHPPIRINHTTLHRLLHCCYYYCSALSCARALSVQRAHHAATHTKNHTIHYCCYLALCKPVRVYIRCSAWQALQCCTHCHHYYYYCHCCY
jgi:hypothetical protein